MHICNLIDMVSTSADERYLGRSRTDRFPGFTWLAQSMDDTPPLLGSGAAGRSEKKGHPFLFFFSFYLGTL